MRARVAALLLLLLPGLAVAEERFNMGFLETPEMKLIWFDRLDHLAPYAIRTFHNAQAWQRRMFDWTPSEKTAVILRDWADYGGASTWTFPRNKLAFDVAPLAQAFETHVSSERLYALMNHELVHVVHGDLANSEDNRYRRLFLGKVAGQPEHPETLLYTYLTVPRYNVPRWFLEGMAVFLETWMAAGLGRAQGSYDEMVFRAMVRDGAHFYDPLGL